jgi:hypothetical protein
MPFDTSFFTDQGSTVAMMDSLFPVVVRKAELFQKLIGGEL